MDKSEFIGKKVVCIDNKPLRFNDVAPPLVLEKEYTIQDVVFDSKGNPHFDVGLVSKYNYIRSIETKEDLPDGNKIHWCHPSRFI